MNRLFMTYGNSFISYANASESLLATLTPPCKHPYNQIVSRNNTAQKSSIGVTTWHIVPGA